MKEGTFAPAAVALVLALSAGCPAMAADCAQATTQTAINACIGDDFARADRTLNILYDRLMKGLDGDDRTRLRDAERAWVAFRDKHCAFIGGPSEGGSLYPTVVGGCKAELTAARVGQLQEQLTCQEGDMSCVR